MPTSGSRPSFWTVAEFIIKFVILVTMLVFEYLVLTHG